MKNQSKKMFFMILFIFGCFFALSQKGQVIKGAEFINKSGEIKSTYENVEVFYFKYDYITKFTEQEGFYNGEDVIDGESLRDEWFYSGSKIEIKLNHVSGWLKFDSISIYSYSEYAKNFASKYKLFSGADSSKDIKSCVLDQGGLYKISYAFDGNVIGKEYYIYITTEMQKASVRGNSEYSNMSVYSYFDFKLSLMDGYDLRRNEYYYAFSSSEENLNFKKLNVFSGPISGNAIYLLEDHEMSIEIQEEDKCSAGEKKRLYIKIVRPGLDPKIIYTKKSYNLSNRLGASVVFFDKKGNDAEEAMYYKKGDIIKGELRFNSPVTFSNLEMSLNGKDFFDLSNASKEVKVVKFEYEVKEKTSYYGGIIIRTKNNGINEVVVNHKGFNTKVDVDKGYGYGIDVDVPFINIAGDTINDSSKNAYNVELIINENNIGKVSFYVSKCTLIQGDDCLMEFDGNVSNLVTLSEEVVKNGTDLNTFTHKIYIDKNVVEGKLNGDKLVLFVRVEDKAGNVSYNKKYGYSIDNVIVLGNVEEIFKHKDIVKEGKAVGKKFSITIPKDYYVSNISYNMLGMDKYSLCTLTRGEYDVYDCFAIEGHYFGSEVKIKITDIFGNEENYLSSFRYTDLEDGSQIVDEYTVNTYKNNDYDLEILNINNIIYKNGEKLSFRADLNNGLKELLGLNKMSSVQYLLIDFIYYENSELITLAKNVINNYEFPTNYEILKMIGNDDKYDKCVLKDQECDFNVYLNYMYTITLNGNKVRQSRLVKLHFVNSLLKFEVDDFVHTQTIEVFSEYNNQEYKVYDDLNNVINKTSDTVSREIWFTDHLNNTMAVGSIDTSKLGSYTVMEKVVYEGIESYPLEYVVKIVDTKAPLIKLVGKSKITVRKGQNLGKIEEFVDVYDECDKDLVVLYSWNTRLDTNVEGEYILNIWTVDSSGNKSDVVTKIIIVTNDGAIASYIISGAIVLFTAVVMFVGVVRERKKEEVKR